MSSDVASHFLGLDFDKFEMEGSLVDQYIKENNKSFGVESEDHVTDVLGNTVYSCHYDLQSFRHDAITSEYHRQVFSSLCLELCKAKELLSEVEYCERGIAQADTRRSVLQMGDLCDALVQLSPPPFHSNTLEEPPIAEFHLGDLSSIRVLSQVLGALAVRRAVKVYAGNNTALLIHLFNSILHKCDVNGYFPRIGPYFGAEPYEGLSEIKGSAVVVCKSGDVDSAVDAVMAGAWGFQGMSPDAVKRILVEDAVWDKFVEKFSKRHKKFKWSLPKGHKPHGERIKNTNRVYESALARGQTVLAMHQSFYEEGNSETLLKPVVVMDEVPYFWDELPNSPPPLVVTLQSFRSSKELMPLLARVPTEHVSLWCNNVSVCNELALGMNVDSVWVNSFGIYSMPILATRLFYNQVVKDQFPSQNSMEVLQIKDVGLSGTHAEWVAMSNEKRASILSRVHQHILQHNSKYQRLYKAAFNPEDVTKNLFEDELLISGSIVHSKYCDSVLHKENLVCLEFSRPLGLVAFRSSSPYKGGALAAVFGSLMCGNAVEVAENDLFSELAKEFTSHNIPLAVVDAQRLNAKYTFTFSTMFNQSKICWQVLTLSKCVWYSYGESNYKAKTMNVRA